MKHVTALQVRQSDYLTRMENELGGDEIIDAKAMMQAIAMDIGKEIVAYVEVQYPKAIEATTGGFPISLKNSIYNEIMAAFEFRGDKIQLAERLRERRAFRKEWLATYRKIRKSNVKEG